MQGFVKAGTQTYYQQTLPLLESATDKGWKNGKTQFYRFGDKIQPLAGRYLEARQPQFYTDRKTLIENVLDEAKPENLTVVLTDLFQNNSDINLLVGKLKEKFINQNLAIGVFLLKSEFNGDIYDVGPKNYTFSYQTTGQPETFRPFYILALGSAANIARYFELLETSVLKDFPGKNAVILSRHLTADFAPPETVSYQKLVLLDSTVKDKRAKEFRLSGNSEASLNLKLPFRGLPYTMRPDYEFQAEITSARCGEKEDAALKNAIQVDLSKFDLNEGKIELNLKIQPASLSDAGDYVFPIVLRPKSYQFPDWIAAADLDGKQLDAWYAAPKTFDGTKTYNLKAFLENLWETTRNTHQPKAAEMYLYIRKR